MAKKKGGHEPFYRKAEWLIPIILSIVLAIYFGGSRISNIDISNLYQSPISIGPDSRQNVTYITNINNYNYYLNESTPNELASDPYYLNQDSYSPHITKNGCISNITTADGIIGGGILIDNCDVLIVKPKDIETPVKSGTVDLWVKLGNIESDRSRYLFDAFDENKRNRISLYLEPDGFLTFSLWDVDYTNIQIREKLTSEELSDWTQIAVTWEEQGGLLKLFINGDLKKARGISSINFDSGFKAFFIGSSISGNEQVYGIIDEVQFSSTARSENWISASYQFITNQDKFVSWGG